MLFQELPHVLRNEVAWQACRRKFRCAVRCGAVRCGAVCVLCGYAGLGVTVLAVACVSDGSCPLTSRGTSFSPELRCLGAQTASPAASSIRPPT